MSTTLLIFKWIKWRTIPLISKAYMLEVIALNYCGVTKCLKIPTRLCQTTCMTYWWLSFQLWEKINKLPLLILKWIEILFKQVNLIHILKWFSRTLCPPLGEMLEGREFMWILHLNRWIMCHSIINKVVRSGSMFFKDGLQLKER